jgi:ribosomal protein S18 acetylase RimI-like enzyme
MNYNIIKANDNDIDYVKKAKLYNIFAFAHDLPEDEIIKINNYVNSDIPKIIEEYKLIVLDNRIIGCYLVVNKDDGIMLDEIFIDDEFRNKGIGSSIISKILKLNNIVYLWVYKENINAIRLYKKFGFKVIEETEIRYYMKYFNH